jgi:CHASE2 domain-containing sensor protein
MSWRALAVVLAVCGTLVAAFLFATGQWLRAIPAAVCAVVFGLEGAGISTLGRTRRALNRLRDGRP